MIDVLDYKIGVVGGGQLGKMLAQEAKRMDFSITVLDPMPNSPAGQIADMQIVSGFYDEDGIKELVSSSDITTYEIEHINTKVLKQLRDEGHRVYPSPEILEIIQDKSFQKQMLVKNNIPTASWKKVEGKLEDSTKHFGFPVVQKSCKGGYDGRGVFIIHDIDDIRNGLSAASYLEEYVDFEKELAIIVARDLKGNIKCYPVVEMIFDQRANICDMTIAPARISQKKWNEAVEIASSCVEALDGVGVFGIEMFLTKTGRVLVNEIAPRPHNSGHYTIEACMTSQFEQHLRAITGLPLGSTELLSPAVMVNVLGSKGYEGKPIYKGIDDVFAIPGTNLHIYGKKETKPFRKMGHVTILDKSLDSAIQKADKVKQFLSVISRGEKNGQ